MEQHAGDMLRKYLLAAGCIDDAAAAVIGERCTPSDAFLLLQLV